jgi:hypothetical protein
MLTLVLPPKETALPDIGKPLAAFGLRNMLLKGEGVSGGIGGGGVRLVEHIAEVNEMGLCGGALGKRAGLPAGDEFSE